MGDYNRWKNYETWCVKLWIDNDQGTQEYWRERTEAAWAESEEGGNPFTEDRSARARILLAHALREHFDDCCEESLPDGMYGDLLTHALGQVEWYEIADAMLTDAEESGDAAGYSRRVSAAAEG